MDYTFRNVGFDSTNFNQSELILARKQMSTFQKKQGKMQN